MPYQRNPPYQYGSLEEVKRDRPPPPGLRSLSFDEKTARFGDPTSPTFVEDYIVEVRFPGFGPSHKDIGLANVNKLIAHNATSAFEEIASLKLPYVINSFGPHATYSLRYGKSTRNAALFNADPGYAGIANPKGESWNVLFADYDRKRGRFDQPVGGETKPRKTHLSNHSWGNALDINPSTNPMGTAKAFDLPPEIVIVMGKWGFYWGGYFNPPDGDYMHFEFSGEVANAQQSIVPPPVVAYPFGAAGKREAPTKYFFLNETGTSGFYPLGLQQNLHGGIHLDPDKLDFRGEAASEEGAEEAAPSAGASAAAADTATELVPVHACLPGYIVAARLIPPDAVKDFPLLSMALDGQPLGMVLVRHELFELKDDGSGPKDAKTYPLFSLYMHLASPEWAGEDGAFEKAPWMERFLRMQHGSVVALDPRLESDLGRTFWAKGPVAKDATVVPVRGRTDPLPVKDGDRIVGVAKPAPAALAEAVEAFKRGALVTFDRPVLTVEAGEVVGFLGSTAAGASSAQRYLHFELFSFAGDKSGLAKLRSIDRGLASVFKELPEAIHNHNFLNMPGYYTPDAPNDLAPLMQGTDPDLEATLTGAAYADRLVKVFNKGARAPLSDTASFTYPVTVRLKNPYNYQPEAGEAGADEVEVSFRQAGSVLSTFAKKLPGFGSSIELKLDVPAAADEILLWGKHFHVLVRPERPPEPPGLKDKERADRRKSLAESEQKALLDGEKALFRSIVGKRWRNLVMVHLNEWTSANLDTYIDTRANAGFLDLDQDGTPDGSVAQAKRELAPLTWWARRRASDADPFGEVLVFGDDGARHDSLFGAGDDRLPKDARIEDMHPVTALWLMDILVQERKVGFKAKWEKDTFIRDKVEDQPLFFGVVQPAAGLRLGREVALAVVEHGYCSSKDCDDPGVSFSVQNEKHELRPLAKASYVEGAAVCKVRFPYWGESRLSASTVATARAPSRALKAERTGQTTLSVPRPEASSTDLPLIQVVGSKTEDQLWTGTLAFEKGTPEFLAGFLTFDFWVTGKNEGVAPGTPPNTAKFAFPVICANLDFQNGVSGGLRLEGELIRGPAAVSNKKKQKAPLAAWNLKVTSDFVLRSFLRSPGGKQVYEGEVSEFALALPLAQRVQALRDRARASSEKGGDIPLEVIRLDRRGRNVDVAPVRSTPETLAQLQELAAKLPASGSFAAAASPDGKALRLTYRPNPEGGSVAFTVDLKPALRQLANMVLTDDKQRLHARPRLVAPNGGHLVFGHTGKPPDSLLVGDVQAYAVDAEGIASAAKGDCLEFAADRVLPPVARFGFGPLVMTMGRGQVHCHVELLGDPSLWAKAAPRITATVDGETITAGQVRKTTLSADWDLAPPKRKGQAAKPARWGKTFSFRVEATQTKGLAQVPQPVTGSFTATPSLKELEVVVDAPDRIEFKGQTVSFPTDLDCRIHCDVKDPSGDWREDPTVCGAVVYERPSQATNRFGRPNEDGSFKASVRKSAFSVAGGVYRFVWHPVGAEVGDLQGGQVAFHGLTIKAVTSREYTAAELGEGKMAAPGGPDHERTDEDELDGDTP